jgi:hypothetical protein
MDGFAASGWLWADEKKAAVQTYQVPCMLFMHKKLHWMEVLGEAHPGHRALLTLQTWC